MASWPRLPLGSLASLIILIAAIGIGFRLTRSRRSVSQRASVCSREPPLVCAHGGLTYPSSGADGIDEENAMLAFTRAVEAHLHCVEVDVAMTSDGHLLALHPKQINAHQDAGHSEGGGGGGGEIHRRVYQQRRGMLTHIRREYADGEDEAREIAELHQVLDALCGVMNTLLIDVKLEPGMQDDRIASFFSSLSKLISSYGSSSLDESTQASSKCRSTHVIVLAKSDSAVSQLTRLGLDAGYVVWNGTEANRRSGQDEPVRKRPIAAVAAAHYTMVTSSVVRIVHAIHRQLLAWTVDDVATALQLMHRGVDVFVTNIPLTIESAMREERAKLCADVTGAD